MTCHCVGGPNGHEHNQRASERYAESARDAEREAQKQIAQKEAEVQKRVAELQARTPNPDQFDIEEIEQVGHHLVLKVKYPNCAKCAYEGLKVLVIEDVDIKDAIKWRRIDPHFVDDKAYRKDPSKVKTAPSPSARFPGSPEGWKRAVAWARFIQETRTR